MSGQNYIEDLKAINDLASSAKALDIPRGASTAQCLHPSILDSSED
ncbi:7760_t:CDS:2 [Paraglomus brasilianum]|uniref:7760_t:CDS:1 n=1 Tax=Paraglomus brasilianum TaxID=144538 RepID=A0A9N8VV12_9GLOM|nr:7760_t:CDS:2 [Paraglomus brasilianum]